MKRYALITTTWDRDNPAAYLPDNYRVLHRERHSEASSNRQWMAVVIGGEDRAGWTLDGYVLPRLASGGMHGVEIDLSHEVMKRAPEITVRDDIIADARKLDPDLDRNVPSGPGSYEGIAEGSRLLAFAIETIGGHGFADAEGGSVEFWLHGYRVANFILWTDDRGFHSLEEFPTDDSAQARLDAEDARQDEAD